MNDIKLYIQVLESELIPLDKQFQKLKKQRDELLLKIEQCKILQTEMNMKLANSNHAVVQSVLFDRFKGKRKIECVTMLALEKPDKIINLKEVADTLIEAGVYHNDREATVNAIQSALAQLKDLWKSLGDKTYQYIGLT